MKLIQRYIMRELLSVFALLVIVLTMMLVLVGVVNEAAERGLGAAQIIKILPYVVPSMLPFTIPATLLLAVTVVYGRLAGDLEITATKAAGVNPLQLLAPAFLLGLVLTGTSFGLTNYAIPWAISNMERIVTQAMEDIFLDVLTAQHYISEPEKGYSITVMDVKDRELVNPTFRYRNGDHEQVTMKASLAKIRFDHEKQEVRVYLKDAHGSIPGRDSGIRFERKEITFPMDQEIRRRNPRHLTVNDIEQKLSESESNRSLSTIQRDQEAAMLLLTGDFHQLAGETIESYAKVQRPQRNRERKMRTEIHSRYAMACSCLFFTFLGGPFAVMQAKRQFITCFIMCFLPILLIYYPLMFLMVNLGKSGTLDPSWAMWIPNVVLAIAGTIVLRRVIRH